MRYLAYGITLESDVRLPEVAELQAAASARADVTVTLAHPSGFLPEILKVVQTAPHEDGAPWMEIARTASGYLVSQVGIADFAVSRHGSEIALCRVGPGVSELTIRHLLLDWILALTLNLRGKQVLHASTVITPWGLCAFVGPSGAGKSTLAASFASAGYPVLCDDCLVLERNDKAGCFECTPAYPGLRLWDDSVEAVGFRERVTQSVAGYMPKHRVVIEDPANGLAAGSHRLSRIYSLSRLPKPAGSEMPRAEPLDGKKALLQLIGRSWLCDPTDKAALVRHFRFFESLAKEAAIRRLHVPDDMALLPHVRNAVLADLADGEGAGVDAQTPLYQYQPRQGAS